VKRTDTQDGVEPAQAATLAVPVWDWPIRLFHWSLVALIAFSWWSAENHFTRWHLWSGYLVLFLLLFRILWGFFGSSTARFGTFIRGPRGVMNYLRSAKQWRAVGHTPLGALSVVAMLGLLAAQVFFGLILIDEDGDWSGPLNRFVDFETGELAHDIHEALFNVLLGFIILHVAAILFYRLVRGKRLVGAMLRGTSSLPAGTEGMVRASGGRLLLCLAVAAALTVWIVTGLPPFGT
jgi:cytochrome b